MSDWGISCLKGKHSRSSVSPACADGLEESNGICYPSCPDSYDGIGPICWGQCPAETSACGILCLGPNEDCTETIQNLTEGAIRMAAYAAAFPTGIGAVFAITEIV